MSGNSDNSVVLSVDPNLPFEQVFVLALGEGFDNQAEAAVNACVKYLTTGDTPADPLAYLDPIIITKDGGTGQQTSADARAHLKTVLGQ